MAKLVITWGLNSDMFLLELHRAHTTDSLLALDALLFSGLKDLLVFYAELSSLDIEAVQCCDNGICIYRLTEIRESQPAELTGLIKVIVECIGCRD